MDRPLFTSEPILSRRDLLSWTVSGLLLGMVLRPGETFAKASLIPTLDVARVPGERICLRWPFFLDPSRARVLVLRDGRPEGHAPLYVRDGGRFVEIEARPPSPVGAGRYDFVLTVGPVRVALGGFRIAPYRFGC